MSIKLYMKNPYIKEFTTKVSSITEKNEKYYLELEKTGFYPEGGGQPSDLGTIGDSKVVHVLEEDDRIYHVVNSIPSSIDKVVCTIDWDRRFDFMQQHLGQHLLSGAFEKLFDAHTVGFHLTDSTLTIDIDKPLDKVDIETVEYYVNQIIFNDLLVTALFPDKETLESLPLRKQPKVNENIRIVKIDDFDCTPCCGTHPNRTGEVGVVKVKKVEKHKSGLRVYFNCGNRAFKDYSKKHHIISSLAAMLSSKPEDLVNNVQKLNDNIYDIKKEIVSLKKELSIYENASLIEDSISIGNVKVIQKIYKNRNINDVKNLLNSIDEHQSYVAFIGLELEEKTQLLFRRSTDLNDVDMAKLLKESISFIDGKGGGSAVSAQGGGKNSAGLSDALNLGVKSAEEILR